LPWFSVVFSFLLIWETSVSNNQAIGKAYSKSLVKIGNMGQIERELKKSPNKT
jgi:hypothetical protein